ncbi:MAG: RNA polymerase sigma factor [Lachnospiraceae bacterium]|nr:RNA polymerase sigma factor [Lachnospiraceae bacterium]MDD7668473.1 RNA polymerase sigma factor [Lachnospiraceae bacterium]MDY2620976.1 RNA polymerase sigma factor [Agathobacter sp.]
MGTKQWTSITEFREFYDRQVKRVYQLAMVMMGNISDAEDVTQTVFLKAWEKKPDFRDADHEIAWILTTTRNQCKDIHKSFYRRKRADLENAPEPQVTLETQMDSEIWEALQSLAEKYRMVLYLYYYEGYSVRELSVILRRRESTLQTQLATGRKQMKSLLESKGEC